MPTTSSGAAKRGFAAMDPAKQREIASKGGKASHGGGRKPARPGKRQAAGSAGRASPCPALASVRGATLTGQAR